ncbi:antiactivator of flagellar biosynthesis FleN protein [Herbaspirillum sp. RTI4]|uniref:MinD/ParA family ATP-binding protein n=1 Tax=Herbaspirillum sp. RTI4 TaxID=3048640 RepID=UPI002AB38763|nr:antiactivator of flagellar biosynthesis FleN protein [Herbaspirillum sp. RTI4]MDY7578291.1 antiactivator of flagellar biosynthesis FleN protein [Herbaspirillum sp. RTI4]MEA9981216.1 antiactivator of flagellar biosynthesis FleN protein [Herbaspirillum sp. RTI4]
MANIVIDQAEGLRRMLERPKPRIFTFLSVLPIAEKNSTLINLAGSLARSGSNVLLVDALDSGIASSALSRLSHPAPASLLDVATQRHALDDAVRMTPQGFNIARLSGPVASLGTHPLALRLSQIFNTLVDRVDLMLVNAELDEEDGLPLSTMEAGEIIIQVTGNSASIKAAYVLLKRLNEKLGRRPVSLLVTGSSDRDAQTVFANMSKAASRYLASQLRFLGSVPADIHLARAAVLGRSVGDAFPRTAAALAFNRLAEQFSAPFIAASAYDMDLGPVSIGV